MKAPRKGTCLVLSNPICSVCSCVCPVFVPVCSFMSRSIFECSGAETHASSFVYRSLQSSTFQILRRCLFEPLFHVFWSSWKYKAHWNPVKLQTACSLDCFLLDKSAHFLDANQWPTAKSANQSTVWIQLERRTGCVHQDLPRLAKAEPMTSPRGMQLERKMLQSKPTDATKRLLLMTFGFLEPTIVLNSITVA